MHHLSQRGRKDKKVIEARVASCTVKRDYGEIVCRHHVWQWGRKGQKNLRQRFHAMCTMRRAYVSHCWRRTCCKWCELRNGGLVTTDMAAALQLLRTIEYQEKTLPSLIRLGSISLDTQLC